MAPQDIRVLHLDASLGLWEVGFDAKVETSRAIDGRKRFKGRLLAVKEGKVTINTKNEVFELAYQDIDKAKLLLSDELIAASEGLLK